MRAPKTKPILPEHHEFIIFVIQRRAYNRHMQPLLQATNRPAAARGPSPEACAERLLDALPPVMRFVRKHMRSHRSKGLSVPQFRTLALLGSTPAANLTAVAEFLGASLPTTSRIVSGLVGKGFVRRCERTGDRRHIELALTARGAAVMESARRATREQLARELAALDTSELGAVYDGIEALRSLFSPALRIGKTEE